MKLRILNDTLRLRLTQSEVRTLLAEGRVAAGATFELGATLGYALEMSASARRTAARFTGGRVVVELPEALARKWAVTARVGIEAEQNVGEGRVMTVLVEKDFKCLHGRIEADAFPHPNAR